MLENIGNVSALHFFSPRELNLHCVADSMAADMYNLFALLLGTVSSSRKSYVRFHP
jgi:hypothetical protein